MRPRIELRFRIRRGDDIAVGPGKIDLLEAIDATLSRRKSGAGAVAARG